MNESREVPQQSTSEPDAGHQADQRIGPREDTGHDQGRGERGEDRHELQRGGGDQRAAGVRHATREEVRSTDAQRRQQAEDQPHGSYRPVLWAAGTVDTVEFCQDARNETDS